MQTALTATDLPDRWNQLRQDYAFVFSRYRADYAEEHQRFQAGVHEALEASQEHEAFQQMPDRPAALGEQIIGPCWRQNGR